MPGRDAYLDGLLAGAGVRYACERDQQETTGDTDGLPTSWVVSFRGEYRYTTRSNEGLRPLGRQSRGKMLSTVSPRANNEGLRPLGRQARGKDDSHPSASGGAASEARKKQKTNQQVYSRGWNQHGGLRSTVLIFRANSSAVLCMRGHREE